MKCKKCGGNIDAEWGDWHWGFCSVCFSGNVPPDYSKLRVQNAEMLEILITLNKEMYHHKLEEFFEKWEKENTE